VSQYQKGKTRNVKPIWIYWSKRKLGVHRDHPHCWIKIQFGMAGDLLAMSQVSHNLLFLLFCPLAYKTDYTTTQVMIITSIPDSLNCLGSKLA